MLSVNVVLVSEKPVAVVVYCHIYVVAKLVGCIQFFCDVHSCSVRRKFSGFSIIALLVYITDLTTLAIVFRNDVHRFSPLLIIRI